MKSQTAYIIVLIISIFLVFFALENAEPVEPQLFGYRFSISLALLIIISIAIGTLLSFIFSFSGYLRMKNKIKKKDSEIKQLKKELNSYTKGTEEEKEEDEEEENKEKEDSGDSGASKGL